MKTVLLPTQGEYREQVELDECWSFVHSKATPIWIWAALCRSTRQIVAFTVGDRSAATGEKLWQKLPQDYQKTFTYSDGWQPYVEFVDLDCHQLCLKEEAQTNHLERWWASLRNRLGRLTRKTLSFSKALQPLEDLLTLFIYNYNLEIYNKYKSKSS